jgi:hypothetical protein
MEHGEIRIQGMDKLEQFAIEKEIPAEYLKVDTARAGGAHGELLTTLIISAAAPALWAFAGWLMKDRDRDDDLTVIEIVAPDGSVHRETRRKFRSSSHSKEGVVKEIARICKLQLPGMDSK